MPVLHAVVRQAQRRKALEPSALPFGVVSLDGKGFSIPAADDWYAQRQTLGSEQRRAVPWKALMADCFFALVSSTVAELASPRPNTC